MKYSYAAIGMLAVGLFAFMIVMIFQSITVGNEADYYTLKEAMEASMFESIDIDYYRGITENASDKDGNVKTTGEVKIVQEKFVSNFTRRFLKNTMGNSEGYVLEFYDIMEKPPKVTVVIKNSVSSMSLSENDFTVVNNLTGILESKIVKGDYNGDCVEGTTLKRGTYESNNFAFLSFSKTKVGIEYELDSNAVKTAIVNNDSNVSNINQIINLRINSTRIVGFSANEANAIQSSNCPTDRISLNASIKIIDSSKVRIFASYSGNNFDGSCNNYCQYAVKWSYNYCK